MTELLHRLRAALTDRYDVERELGRGGMAVVYLARDLKHERAVAIKVLRPELAASLGGDRFLREIRITARLNHPHILPVHDSGEADGLLFYVMPCVEGESLRELVQRQGRLSVAESLLIARQVATALSYAHTHGLIHRDIKPENILLSDGEAVIADFGIARAVSAAAGEVFTVSGFPLGTMGYMSPEQAMGSADLDGRSDVYSLGCVLYEMLLGRPPGRWSNRQSLHAGQLHDTPPEHREALDALPRGLERVLVRALAERPDDRYQNARELTEALGARSLERRSLVERVGVAGTVGLYLLGAVIALGLTRFLVLQLGLPTWTQHGVAVLALAGFLAVLGAAFAERRRIHGAWSRWLSWRRTLKSGAVALAVWGGVVGLYMAMRTFGVGPVATLVGAGVFEERERVLLADLENHTTDTLLAAALTEALRIDLAQSPAVRLVEPEYVNRTLRRMQREPNSALDLTLAREVAIRDGVEAVIAGEINTAGSGFMLSARIVNAETGETLAAHRETAVDSSEVIQAIDRLSRRLRERIGESLRTVRASEPLEQVTTTSLAALRRYTLANQAFEAGDRVRAVALLREATELDTAFAMAYRRLAVWELTRADQFEALERAYQLRDRLTDRERSYVLGTYYSQTEQRDATIATYRGLLETYPDDVGALTNLAFEYMADGDFASAEPLYRRVVELDSLSGLYSNLIIAQVALGESEAARQTIDQFRTNVPGHPSGEIYPILIAVNDGEYDSAEVAFQTYFERYRNNPLWTAMAGEQLAQLLVLRGRLLEAQEVYDDVYAVAAGLGLASVDVDRALQRALVDVWFRERGGAGLVPLDSVLQATPIAGIPAPDRPYADLVRVNAAAGRVDRARALLADYESTQDPHTPQSNESRRQSMLGWIALAEERPRDAATAFRAADRGMCPTCMLPMLGMAYELAGETDSAIAAFERYVATPWIARLDTDMFALADTYERLGPLYERRGQVDRAIEAYTRFIDLWERADPELQPRVRAAQRALATLSPDR